MGMISNSLWLVGSLFIGLLITQEVGRILGVRRVRQGDMDYAAGASVVDGAVFALISLLIAFSFSSAAAKFDARRALIVTEVNIIGTAYQRLDLLPAPAADQLRDSLRKYVDLRISVYRALPDIEAAQAGLNQTTQLQHEIWSDAVAATKDSVSAALLLLPALNEVFDIATTRANAALIHPPDIIIWVLAILSLSGGVLAGFSGAKSRDRDWIHMFLFALTLTGAIYLILELEYPRFGLIRVTGFDHILVDLRASMH